MRGVNSLFFVNGAQAGLHGYVMIMAKNGLGGAVPHGGSADAPGDTTGQDRRGRGRSPEIRDPRGVETRRRSRQCAHPYQSPGAAVICLRPDADWFNPSVRTVIPGRGIGGGAGNAVGRVKGVNTMAKVRGISGLSQRTSSRRPRGGPGEHNGKMGVGYGALG